MTVEESTRTRRWRDVAEEPRRTSARAGTNATLTDEHMTRQVQKSMMYDRFNPNISWEQFWSGPRA